MCTIGTATLTRTDNMQSRRLLMHIQSFFCLLPPDYFVCAERLIFSFLWFAGFITDGRLYSSSSWNIVCVQNKHTHTPCFNWIWQATRGRTSVSSLIEKGTLFTSYFWRCVCLFWWSFMLTGVNAVWFISLTNSGGVCVEKLEARAPIFHSFEGRELPDLRWGDPCTFTQSILINEPSVLRNQKIKNTCLSAFLCSSSFIYR